MSVFVASITILVSGFSIYNILSEEFTQLRHHTYGTKDPDLLHRAVRGLIVHSLLILSLVLFLMHNPACQSLFALAFVGMVIHLWEKQNFPHLAVLVFAAIIFAF